MSERRPIPALLRGVIIERFGRTCQHCGGSTDTWQHGPDGRPWHVDHRTPLALGGTDDEANLILSCVTCNLKKHAADPESDWRNRACRGHRQPTRATRLRHAASVWQYDFPLTVGHLAYSLFVRVKDLKVMLADENLPYRIEVGGTWNIPKSTARRLILRCSGFTAEELDSDGGSV